MKSEVAIISLLRNCSPLVNLQDFSIVGRFVALITPYLVSFFDFLPLNFLIGLGITMPVLQIMPLLAIDIQQTLPTFL